MMTKTEDRQKETYEEMKVEIERGLEELNLHVPVHEGFLHHPADTGREK